MSKKRWLGIGVSMVCVLSLLAVSCGKAAEEEVTILRLASWGGTEHVGLVSFVPTFIDEVQTLSGGKIKVEYYPGGALGEDKDMPTALPAGTMDMAWITINGWSGVVPNVKILDSPALGLTMEQLAKAIDMPGGLNEIIGAEFEAAGVKLLAWCDLGPCVIASNKLIRKPSDLKGMKLRVFSEGGGEVVKACGAAPTKIAFAEVYVALQRGTVDAAHMGLQGVASQKTYEICEYCLIPSGFIGTAVMGWAMNLDFFNSLSPELQKAVLEASRVGELAGRKALIDSRAGLVKDYEGEGMEVFDLTPAAKEWPEWESTLKPVVDKARAGFPQNIIAAIDKAKE